jgi:hypothetical protein
MRTVFILSSLILMSATAAFAEKPAPAAQLSGISGEILINSGEGFQPVTTQEPVALMPGTKVMVRDNSFATVSYAECAIALAEPTVFTVNDKAPCEQGAPLPDQAMKITPTHNSLSPDQLHPELPFVRAAVVIGMIGGSVAVLIHNLTDDDEDDEISGNGRPTLN